MLKVINKKINLIRPSAVLFDTDNTLYEYEPANKKATITVAEEVKNLLGINEKEFLKNIINQKNKLKCNLVIQQVVIVDFYIFKDYLNSWIKGTTFNSS